MRNPFTRAWHEYSVRTYLALGAILLVASLVMIGVAGESKGWVHRLGVALLGSGIAQLIFGVALTVRRWRQRRDDLGTD